jgi:hypothetical protein
MDGTNGSTTFTDSSTTTKTAVAGGAASISTASLKFGTGAASIYNSSTGKVTVNYHTDFEFGSGDFTIEFWVYFTDLSSYPMIIIKSTGTGYSPWTVFVNGGYFCARVFDDGTTPTKQVDITGTTAVTTGTWYFVQLRRRSNVFALAVNGVQEATTSALTSFNVFSSTADITLGNYPSGTDSPLYGYIDDLRLIKGQSMDFNLPTAAFPNS